MKTSDPRTVAGRAFIRSLNILLKFARLYGFEHSRTTEQLDTAWRELRAAIPTDAEAGLLLATTGKKLLLDGVALEGSPAEQQFAQLLEAAGVGSIQFFASITQDELTRLVRSFPSGKSKPSELAEQLKAAMSGAQGVRINEICFVATDSRMKEASMAAQLAASSLGSDDPQFQKWLKDPQKLLEMIAAAQGASAGSEQPAESAHGHSSGGTGGHAGGGGGPAGGGTVGAGSAQIGAVAPQHAETTSPAHYGGSGPGLGAASGTGAGTTSFSGSGSGTGSGSGSGSGAGFASGSSHGEPSEEEMYRILGALTRLGNIGGTGGAGAVGGVSGAFHEEMAQLPTRAQDLMKRALAELAARAPGVKPDQTVLIQLAEHLAIRFALERFERGEVKVNAVRQMLDRMNQEIDHLRRVVGAHEDQLAKAGLVVESHRDILDRQFWAAVPERHKHAVLLSKYAWCIPPRNVRSYVNDLVKKGNTAEAIEILQNYAGLTESEDVDARKKAATGLSELAELYAQIDPKLLIEALRQVGVRLTVEQSAEVQAQVSAAFVRLSHEAAAKRCYPAMERALELLNGIELQRPGIARSLRDKMGIEERVPEFLEEAMRAKQVAAGLTAVLRLLPKTSMELLAARFNRCGLRDDAEHVSNLAHDLGEEGVQYLRSTVRGGPVNEAVEMVGLLSRLDPQSLTVFLPSRIKDFPRASQDRVVRQLAASAAPERCHILLGLLDHVDPLVMPIVIDEIGVAGERDALGRLMNIVEGDLPAGAGAYLRVKAAEALGRIHAPESIAALKRIVEGKKLLRWLHPQELRIAAWQALERLDPAWAREFFPKSGIDKADLTLPPLPMSASSRFVRQRRHARVRLSKPVTAISVNLKENCRMEIRTASLVGGLAHIDRHLAPGTQVQLKLQVGMRHLQATALMRDYRAQGMSFEIVDMSLDERSKLRRLLAESLVSGNVPEVSRARISASKVA